MKRLTPLFMAAALLPLACADGSSSNEPSAPGAGDFLGPVPPPADGADDNDPGEDGDLVVATSGKTDTGYLSDLATELEGVYSAEIQLDVSDLDETSREDLAAIYRGDRSALENLIDEQMKFGKNQLNTENLHINLSTYGSEIESVIGVSGDTLTILYEVKVETIVSFAELAESGITPADIKDKSFPVTLPGDPQGLFSRVGDSCAEGHDEGKLEDFNYFYYFVPEKEGCTLPTVDGTFTVQSLLPTETTYPEYHLLKADGEITAIVFFGTAKYDWKPGDWDWGVYEHDQLIRAMKRRGFREAGRIEPTGTRYVRERNGVRAVMDVIEPADMYEREDEMDTIFAEMIRTHEIVIYNGHSFYGSLDVLDARENFPEDTYQIFSMNSCWSYEYYTKQIFANKVTDADPSGWALADVVNDTEAGWFHNNAEISRILLTNVFTGAEVDGRDGDRFYTWANIIGAMNKHAIDDWKRRGLESHEIFGVSGVRTNRFDPDNPNPEPIEPVAGEWTVLEGETFESAHPYDNDTEISKTFSAPEGAKQLKISFSMFDLEEDYDFVEVYDGAENLVERYSGQLGAFETAEIHGGKATVKFISDYSVTYDGFVIDAVKWR